MLLFRTKPGSHDGGPWHVVSLGKENFPDFQYRCKISILLMGWIRLTFVLRCPVVHNQFIDSKPTTVSQSELPFRWPNYWINSVLWWTMSSLSFPYPFIAQHETVPGCAGFWTDVDGTGTPMLLQCALWHVCINLCQWSTCPTREILKTMLDLVRHLSSSPSASPVDSNHQKFSTLKMYKYRCDIP